MSYTYTFYIYINSITDLQNLTKQTSKPTVSFENYNVEALLYRNLPEGSPLESNVLSNPCEYVTADKNCIPCTSVACPSYSDYTRTYPITSMKGGMTLQNGTTESLSIASDILPKLTTPLTNTQFITFRNMKASDSSMSIDVPSGSCSTTQSLCSQSYDFYESGGNGTSFFYKNGTAYTTSQSVGSKTTYGIGCKYFYPPLGVCNPSKGSNSLKNYPIGTTFLNPLTVSTENSYYLNIVAGVCHLINSPNISKPPPNVSPNSPYSGISPNSSSNTSLVGNSNCSFTGVGQFNYNVFIENAAAGISEMQVFNGFVPVDLLYNGKPTFTCPINQLLPAYSKAPNNGNSSTGYKNPFSSASSIQKKYSYYSYGNLKPTVSLFLGESKENAMDGTPSAIFQAVYTLTESDFQLQGIQNQILDMLNFYNTLYSFTNSEFTKPTISTSFTERLNSSNENFGTVTMNESSDTIPSPVYGYYVDACESAKRIMIDYCTLSGNMANSLCSSTGTGQNLFTNLGLNGSACTDPFSSCSNAWSTYCSNSNTFLSTPCKNYFASGVQSQTYMDEEMQTQLRQICGDSYTAANGKNLSSSFYDICGCYLPESVYNDILEKYNIQGQPVGSVQCWYPSCRSSSTPLMNSAYLKCPDTSVSTCIQKSFINLTDVNGNIKNINASINQIMKKCNATQVFDEEKNNPVVPDTTNAPIKVTIGSGEYDNVILPTGSLTYPNTAKRFYPGGFVAVVLIVFCFLAALLVTSA